MSAEFKGQDPIKLAQQAERDLNSNGAKTGSSGSDSSTFHASSNAMLSLFSHNPAFQPRYIQTAQSSSPDPFTQDWSFEEALTF